MRTKAFAIAVAVLILSACGNQQKYESEIEKTFKEYVKTDFGNPKDFVEITNIGKPDTLDFSKIKPMIYLIERNGFLLPRARQEKAKKAIREIYSDTTYQLIAYPVKVRQKSENGLVVKKYYVIDQKGEKWVQTNKLMTFRVPEYVYVITETASELENMY